MQAHKKNQAPLSYSAELSQQAYKEALIFKAKGNLNNTANIDKLINNLDIIKNDEISKKDENNYFKFLDSIKDLFIDENLRDIKTDMVNYAANKKEYDDLYYIVNKSIYVKNSRAALNIYTNLANTAQALRPQALQLTDTIRDNMDLLSSLDRMNIVDSAQLQAIISSVTILLKDLKADFADKNDIKNNILSDLKQLFPYIKNLKDTIYPLSLQINFNNESVKALELNENLDFDINKLASNVLLDEINKLNKIAVSVKNAHDGNIYARYINLAIKDKKVYNVDLFAFSKKAMEYGLTNDQYINYVVNIINEKAGSGIVFLNNLSALSYHYNQDTSVSDIKFINDHLAKILASLKMQVVVPIENNIAIEQSKLNLPLFNLALSKSVINELIIDSDTNAIDTRNDILEIAKKLLVNKNIILAKI